MLFFRLTVFRSNELPITVCALVKADEIYQEFLGTKYFKVPINETNRLSKWPGLEPSKLIEVTGLDNKYSCKDIVLSSAGNYFQYFFFIYMEYLH